MKITITVENEQSTVSVTRTAEWPDGNPRFDAWEINQRGPAFVRAVAAMFGDPDDRPKNL